MDEVESDVRMLESGRASAFFTNAQRALYAWSEAGFPMDRLVLGKPLRTDQLFVASNKLMPAESMAKLKAAFESMKADGTYTTIFKRYFGDARTNA